MARFGSIIKSEAGCFAHVKLIMFCALFAIALDTSDASSKIREVAELEFRGLKNLTRYEVMRDSGLSVKGKKIIVDMAFLEKKLSSMAIIDSFRINIKDNRLIVSVNEKIPFASFAVVYNGKTVFFEVDKFFNPVSKNRKYSQENPLIVIEREDLSDGRLSKRARCLCSLLGQIREKHKSIFNEVSEIYLNKSEMLKVILKNRNTEFYMTCSEVNFRRLKYVAGYLDRRKHYPEELHITGNRIAIR